MTIDPDLLGPVRRVYDEYVLAGDLKHDPAQTELVTLLDKLLTDLDKQRLSSKSSSLGWLFGKKTKQSSDKQGLYIWGGVGRGKSFLMDLFYDAATIAPKRRVHFNDFMQETHKLIHEHRQKQKNKKNDQKDPVIVVGRKLAQKSRLLCFDEFSVTDITDAMLLGRLFKVLFEEGTTIVVTSNIPPQDLYLNGLNRRLFLPFIDLLQAKMDVKELDSITDYRQAKLPKDKLYSYPLNPQTEAVMDEVWDLLTDDADPAPALLEVNGRQITIPQSFGKIARFHFDHLCREPKGVADYLAIAHRYNNILIDGVPILRDSERNEAKRFILLIDVFYDNHKHVVISAESQPEEIYQAKSGRESFEFDRTVSRLIEMQSKEYNSTHSAL